MVYHYKTGVIVPFAQRFYRYLIAAVAAMFLATLASMTLGANAMHSVILVTPNDLALPSTPTTITDSWYFYNDTNDTASDTVLPGVYNFTTGPDNPVQGDDSVSFNLSASNERWNIATNRFAGQKLSSWNKLSFDMYTPSTSAGGTTATLFLNFDVDFDTTAPGPGATNTAGVALPFSPYQHRLVYVPQQNGAPTTNMWQTWNAGADTAQWTWSRYAAAGNKWPDGNTNEYRTLADLKAAFPNIGVFNEGAAGQFLVRAGHPGPTGLQGSVDNIVVGKKTFDFEKARTPTSKDNCKNGGWKTFNTPTTFKNQGECVEFMSDVKVKNYVLSSTDMDGIDIPTKDDRWYEVIVSGTWMNRGVEAVDTECASYNAAPWANVVVGGYSPDLLDVQLNQSFINWGACSSVLHTYTTWVYGDESDINLRVFDGDVATNTQTPSWFGDNVGSLNVTVKSHKYESNDDHHDKKHKKDDHDD